MSLSRREWWKVVKGGIGGGMVVGGLNLLGAETENMVAQFTLEQACELAKRYEEIPPELAREGLPEVNPHFCFPEQMIEQAITIYGQMRKNNPGLSRANFQRSEVFLGLQDIPPASRKITVELGWNAFNLLKQSYYGNGGDLQSTLALWKGAVPSTTIEALSEYAWSVEKPTCKPFSFLGRDEWDIFDVINFDPGSGLLATIKRSVENELGNGVDYSVRDQTIAPVLQRKVHDNLSLFWAWVDQLVAINGGRPVNPSYLIAGMMVWNNGDVRGATLDAGLAAKLAARHHPKTYTHNDYGHSGYVMLEPESRESVNMLLRRVQDTFAPRISANFIFDRAEQLEPYYTNSAPIMIDHKAHNYQVGSIYSMAGNLYHGLCTTASCFVAHELLVPPMLASRYPLTLVPSGDPFEKKLGDFLVASRAHELQEMVGI